MKPGIKLLAGAAVSLAFGFASPVLAQSYYGNNPPYYDESRIDSRDEALLDSVRDLMSEVRANRNELRSSFFTSAMRNLRSIESNITNARYLGGLTERQYDQNRSLLDRTEARFDNELRTARRYDDYDSRYAYRR
jgi:hypothetical protein